MVCRCGEGVCGGVENGGGLAKLVACDREVGGKVAAVGRMSGDVYKDWGLKGGQVGSVSFFLGLIA